MKHGRVGLGKLLCCRVYGHGHAYCVREFGSDERGGEGERFLGFARNDRGYRHINDLCEGFPGGNGDGHLGTAAVPLEGYYAGNGDIGHGRNRDCGIPDVSFIEETGLLHGNLYGETHYHFPFSDGVSH